MIALHSRVSIASAFIVRETGPDGPPKPRLLDRVREAIRTRHYSRRTEHAYVAWIRKRHPAEMGAPEITRFLTWLAVHGKVAASSASSDYSQGAPGVNGRRQLTSRFSRHTRRPVRGSAR